MHQNNVFTVAKRTLEGQDMVYQSIKFTNNVWALAELKIQPGNPNITVKYSNLELIQFSKLICGKLWFFFQLALKSRAIDVCQGIYQMYDTILHS